MLARREQHETRQARLNRQCECNHKRRAMEQPEARQSMLERQHDDHERRAMEQPEARQSRLERQHDDHERRAMEQPEARQSRLERQPERYHEIRAMEQPEARQPRLEHRGSLHVHGLAWLPGAPDVELFTDPAAAEENRQQAILHLLTL